MQNVTHTLTVEGEGSFEVPHGKRLVLALEDEAKIDQLHACGGVCKCTTCRVTVVDGKPSPLTEAEVQTLRVREIAENPTVDGVRLSCQMTMIGDLTVRAESRLAGSGRKDAGGRPGEQIEPEPTFVTKP